MTESTDPPEELFGDAIRGAISESLGQEDDEVPFEYLADEPDSGTTTAYGKGKNLRALRQARAEILDGSISLEEYQERVEDILVAVSRAVDLLEMDSVKKTESTLPGDQAEVVAQTRDEMKKLEAGIDSMLSYAESQALGDLEEGMSAVEEAMLALTKIQDTADVLAQKEREARLAESQP